MLGAGSVRDSPFAPPCPLPSHPRSPRACRPVARSRAHACGSGRHWPAPDPVRTHLRRSVTAVGSKRQTGDRRREQPSMVDIEQPCFICRSNVQNTHLAVPLALEVAACGARAALALLLHRAARRARAGELHQGADAGGGAEAWEGGDSGEGAGGLRQRRPGCGCCRPRHRMVWAAQSVGGALWAAGASSARHAALARVAPRCP